jgi:CubicO group peptidase (beta-lactamase class C family)
MLNRFHRRAFVRQVGKGLGCSLLSLAGCSRRAQESASSTAPAAWASRIANLEKGIPKLMDASKVPGLSIALIRDDKVVWTRGFGVKDRASGALVDHSTVFEAASMSKPVFAYVVMKACEKGVLNLDTPLVKYTRQRFLECDPRLDLITARHVLSHTAGFQDIRSGDKPLKIHFNPGEKWMYSGEGYFYLQAVMTDLTSHVNPKECIRFEADLEVCATDFDAYMKTNLLAPFGMNGSGYVWTETLARYVARAHDGHGDPLPYRKPTPAAVARYGAMGRLLTTATDYAKFLIEVIEPRPEDAFRLSQASLAEMLRPQVKVEDGDGYSISWALGWRTARTDDGELVSHGGDQTGFHSTSEISVAGKSGYVILTNGDSGWKLVKHLAPEISRWVHSHPKA